MKSSSARRSSAGSSKVVVPCRILINIGINSGLTFDSCRLPQSIMQFCAVSRKRAGRMTLSPAGTSSPFSSQALRSTGSGQSAAQMTARHAARGSRAHQICKVEMCPRLTQLLFPCVRGDPSDGKIDLNQSVWVRCHAHDPDCLTTCGDILNCSTFVTGCHWSCVGFCIVCNSGDPAQLKAAYSQ